MPALVVLDRRAVLMIGVVVQQTTAVQHAKRLVGQEETARLHAAVAINNVNRIYDENPN